MTKIKARDYVRKGLGKSMTKKKHKYNSKVIGRDRVRDRVRDKSQNGNRSQKGGSTSVFELQFMSIASDFTDINDFYKTHILCNLEGGLISGSADAGSGEAARGGSGGAKKVNAAGEAFTLKNPISGGTLSSFQKTTNDNMEYFLNNSISREITHIMVHGDLFGLGESYFQVPQNIVVCILPEINYYSSIYETNRIFRKSGGIDDEKLFYDIFDYLAQMTQGEEFEFKTVEKISSGLRFSEYFCTNTFRNSTWFYPGQFCYNVLLSMEASKYKKQLLDVIDVYETTSFGTGAKKGRREKGEIGKVSINYRSKLVSLTKIFQSQENRNKKMYTDLYNMCKKDTHTRRVIILESCQVFNLKKAKLSLVEYELFKKFMFFQHQANVNLASPSGAGDRKFQERKLSPDNTYKYLCVSNPVNSLYAMDYYTANIDQFVKYGFQKVRDFDKNKRTIEEALDMFFYKGFLIPTYEKYIRTLNFTEMLGFIDLLKSKINDRGVVASFTDGDDAASTFCELYLDNDWFEKKRFIFPSSFFFYHYKSDIALNTRQNIFKIMSDRLKELEVLKSYLNAESFKAFEFFKIFEEILSTEKPFLLINHNISLPSLPQVQREGDRSRFKTVIFQEIDVLHKGMIGVYEQINQLLNKDIIKEVVIEDSIIYTPLTIENRGSFDILKFVNSFATTINLIIHRKKIQSFLKMPISLFKNLGELIIQDTIVVIGMLVFEESLTSLTSIKLVNLIAQQRRGDDGSKNKLDLYITSSSLQKLVVEDCKFSLVSIQASKLNTIKFYNGGDLLKHFAIQAPTVQDADFCNITFLSEHLPNIPRLDSLKFEKCRLVGEFNFAPHLRNLKYLTVIEMVGAGGAAAAVEGGGAGGGGGGAGGGADAAGGAAAAVEGGAAAEGLVNLEDLIIQNEIESLILEKCIFGGPDLRVDPAKRQTLEIVLTHIIQDRNDFKNNFTLSIDPHHAIMDVYKDAKTLLNGGEGEGEGEEEEEDNFRPCRS